MAITLNGTTGITTPDVNVTAQSSNIVTTGNITAVDATLSGGVYVGGTAAANKLDDYEEGTFTPTYTGSSGGSFTANYQSGTYTKVGNLVSWQLVINGNKNTLSGNITITGFPFVAISGETGAGTFIGFCRSFATDMPNLRAYMQGGTGGLSFRKQATNSAGGTTVTSTDMLGGSADNYLYLSGHYIAV